MTGPRFAVQVALRLEPCTETVPGVATFQGPAGLADFLPRCDILVCLLPLTAETADLAMIGR